MSSNFVVGALAIAMSSSGFYADQAGALNGELFNTGIKLEEAAASKVDDTTDLASAQLAIKIGFENFHAQGLQVDISSRSQYGPIRTAERLRNGWC